jgi:hypothetical protein
MNCNITSTNWLQEISQKITCGISTIPMDQLRVANIGLQIESLLCKCPTILDAEADPSCNIAGWMNLSQIYDRIKCGKMLTEAEMLWAQTNIFIKEKECCDITESEDSESPGDTESAFTIFDAGIYTWNGGTFNQASIPIPGLLATDIILTTLVARTSTETLDLSENDAANEQINLVLSAFGNSSSTKIAYQVLRAN